MGPQQTQTKLLRTLVEQYVPQNLIAEVENVLKENGFKDLQQCTEVRGAWETTNPRNGMEAHINRYHLSIYRKTGIFEPVSYSYSFSSGKKVFSMEKRELVRRFPLREDSDTE